MSSNDPPDGRAGQVSHGDHREHEGHRGAIRAVRPVGAAPRYRRKTELDTISGHIISASIQIHRDLGPGLSESTYERILERALIRRGLTVERQVLCDFAYDGMLFRRGIRLDLFVEGSVAVELKAESQPSRTNPRQVIGYLELLDLPLGLLINFGLPQLRHGIHRFVHGELL